MKLAAAKIPKTLFWSSLLFCTLYVSYRYPFKMATSTTSPTYGDTPATIQIAKFIIILFLCILSGVWALRTPMKWRKAALIVALVYLQVFVLLKALYNFDVSYMDQAFWPLAAITIALSVREIDTVALDAFMRFLLFYSVASDVAEIFMFVVFHRLPAQGYPNSIVVRFGGWLDAPNDFACVLFLLMGWAFYRYQGAKRIVIEGLLLVLMLATQSLTAYAFLMLVVLAAILLHIRRRPAAFLWIVPALVLMAILVLVTSSDLIQNIWQNKAGSIEGHLKSPREWFDSFGMWFVAGAPTYQAFEDWWLGSLINFGVVWVGICAASMAGLLLSVAARFRTAVTRVDKGITCGILLFTSYCIVGSLNLPLFKYFPVNFLFYLFCSLAYLGKLRFVSTAPKTISINYAAIAHPSQ